MLQVGQDISEQDSSGARNHPFALRMAVIAFINQNIAIACMWGSFSVLLGAVETRLGVGRELSTLGAPAINLSTAIFAPVVGVLAARFSLRLVMLVGSILTVAGYILLALATTYPLYLLAYGVLLGPGMAVGVILPATLLTRWFTVDRGKALGIVTAPTVITVVPIFSTWMLQAHGLIATYIALAALSALSVIANLFIIDRPPGSRQDRAAEAHGAHAPNRAHGAHAPNRAHGAHAPGGAETMGIGQLLRLPRFWVLVLAYVASVTGSVVFSAHIVPMARSWGYPASLAATLFSIELFAGIAGTVLFGWIADRLGGALALVLVVFDPALLWLLLLLHPPFAGLVVLAALIGVHAAGVLPVMGLALSEAFGRESFSRAYGLVNLINLPFSVLCVPAASMVYAHTGSYDGAIMGVAAFLGLASLLAVSARRPRAVMAT